MDLERRWREDDLARDEPKSGEFWYDVKYNPYFSIVAGLGIGVASWFAMAAGLIGEAFDFSFIAPMIAAAFLVLRGIWQFGQRSSRKEKPKLNRERELLTAIQAAGTITPIEAALETSLTVDEAEEMLSRLAERGHLMVESRDGALLYALPGRRGLEDSTAPGV